MPYIGHSPEVAQRRYESVDDISGSFNGSTTSFALQVGGVTPTPFPVASENVLISVGGVIQEPDGGGTNGFQLTGTNIVFSSAPAAGQSFFGVILAGADYVTAGHAFPDGDAAGPSITFSQDLDTGVFRPGSGSLGFGGNGSEHARIDGSGRLLVGTTTARSTGDVTAPLQVEGTGFNTSSLNLISNAGASSGNVSHISLAKSRGTSDGSSTVVASGDSLGTIQWCGADGTDLNASAASITASVDDAPGSNDMPGRMVLATTANGADSPTERVRITSTGKIGVGSNDPARFVHVLDAGSSNVVNVRIQQESGNTSTDGGALLELGGTRSDGTYGFYGGIKGGRRNSAADNKGYLAFFADDNDGQSMSERMRLNHQGQLLVGADFTTATVATSVQFRVRNGLGGHIAEFNRTDNVDGVSRDMCSFRRGSAGSVGSITCSNSATAFNTSSDYRLKENVALISDGITRVKQLKPSRFNFIINPGIMVDGFIAHEAATVVPEAVSGRHNGVEVWREGEELPEGVSAGDNKLDAQGNTIPVYQGIDQSKLVPLLTAALQEAISEIEALETQNTAQQTTIDDLLARVTALEAA